MAGLEPDSQLEIPEMGDFEDATRCESMPSAAYDLCMIPNSYGLFQAHRWYTTFSGWAVDS